MPLIIIATDFSNAANNAVNYTCRLAMEQQAQLVIIYSYMIPVSLSDVPIPVTIVNDTQSDADANMTKLVAELSSKYPGLSVRGKVIYGDTLDAIEEFTHENPNPWMVAIGNSAPNENTWLDSIAFDAMKELKYPVLALPPGIEYTSFKKICFAFDNKHTGNEAALKELKDIATQLRGELHVLNVQQDVHNQDNAPDVDELAKVILAPVNPHYHMIFESENVDKTIEDFIIQHNIDLLIMIPRKHSFFEGLFHKSHIKTIASHIRIPILTLHDSPAK